MAERVVTQSKSEEDFLETSLRPQYLHEFIGQQAARDNLRIFIEAAKQRADALDHVLF
jgi:holliday junction DNA helicase RuvB